MTGIPFWALAIEWCPWYSDNKQKQYKSLFSDTGPSTLHTNADERFIQNAKLFL